MSKLEKHFRAQAIRTHLEPTDLRQLMKRRKPHFKRGRTMKSYFLQLRLELRAME